MRRAYLILVLLLWAEGIVAQSPSKYSDSEWHEFWTGRHVSCFEQDNYGYIWVGSDDGLYRLDGYKMVVFKNDPVIRETILEDHVTALKEDGDRLWIGYKERGLSCLNLKSMEMTHFRSSDTLPNTMPPGITGRIMIDHSGVLWTGHPRKGFSGFDPSTGEVFRFPQLPGISTKHSLSDQQSYNSVYEIVEDSKHRLWIASHHGLYVLDETRTKLELIPTPQDPSSPYLDVVMLSEELVGDTMLYLGLWASDFRSYNTLRGTWKVYDNVQYSGIPYPAFNEIFWDKEDGLLWLTDEWHGIYGLDLSSGQVFFEKLPEDKSNYVGRFFIDRDDMWWQAGPKNCLMRESEEHSPPSPQQIKPRISGVYVGTSPGFHGEVDTIYLQHPFSDFAVEYSALRYRGRDKIEYAYMLEGHNDNWLEVGGIPFANYVKLGGGEYKFKVRARYNGGEWSEAAEFHVIVKEPFWRSTWFLVLLIVFTCGLIYGAYLWRIREIRRLEETRSALQRRIAEEEMRALRAQMNPHFIFNALNSINRQIVKSDTKTASLYLTRFARLMRLTLDNSESKQVPLSSELEALKLYIEMEALRFDHKFTYSITVENSIDQDVASLPPLIIQPFVENAIWHGLLNLKDREGHLEIRISKSDNQILIVIEDNGVGRKMAAELRSKTATTRKSMGIRLTEDRIAMMSQETGVDAGVAVHDLFDSQGVAAGTRVELRLPYSIIQE
jgi:hypothetical protein